ncbi:MAG: hypothetical protein M1817_000474, partial [Caeruleum heppii]
AHPLLAQIPLTVSPFVSLPTATTLPYTYKSLPSTLPPSSTGGTDGSEKGRYVVSAAGHAAHPDEIIASCQALQAHLETMKEDAEKMLRDWDVGIKERELAEKRRVAPGWLDREEKILEPARVASPSGGDRGATETDLMSQDWRRDADEGSKTPGGQGKLGLTGRSTEGDELDRAFGGMDIR